MCVNLDILYEDAMLCRCLALDPKIQLYLNSSVLQDFSHTLRVVSGGGGFVEFLRGNQQLVLTFLQVLFKALHTTVQSVHLIKELMFFLACKINQRIYKMTYK